MSVDDYLQLPSWARDLGLRRHPEGGWYAETWHSEVSIPQGILPAGFPGARWAASAIYFLLLPGEQSAWHTVRGAELWLHHRGGAIQLDIGSDGPEPGNFDELLLGPDLLAGQRPQLIVPAGCWQRARPVDDEPALVSCIVAPGFDFADFRLQDSR